MEIDSKKDGNALVLALKGKMDAVSAPDFDKKFSEWLTAGESRFVIDFNALNYISSAGLRSILFAAKQIKAKDGTLILSGLNGTVQEVFKLSGFYSIFQIVDTEADAVRLTA